MVLNTQKKLTLALYSFAAIILAALLYVRLISGEFVLGTDTFTHPYKSFVAALILSGLVWMCLIPILKRTTFSLGRHLYALVFFGIVLRAMFLGSTPIYEDDWNRYLWDGVVTAQGINPYEYPPDVTFTISETDPAEVKELGALSRENDNFTGFVNNPHLTTIYPPVAMGVFTAAALIKPFSFDALRGVYLILELGALWLLSKALRAYGRKPQWALLYWLNPMLIYSVYNAGHMDVILVPFLIGALYLVKQRPLWASLMLGLAAAVKIWPLILGPVLLRGHRKALPVYIGGGMIMGIAALVLLSPMLFSLGETSGLQAYASGWQRSSFLFTYFEKGFGFTGENAGSFARLFVGLLIIALSLILAFKKGGDDRSLPAYLMIIPLFLFLLSPTGYPWYILWFLPFLPFFPLYGAGLLTVTVSLYYVRYALSERDLYELYTNALVPLQFGLPMLILLIEAFKLRRAAHA